MCGIVAVINSKVSTNQLINSFNKLRKINFHRGPDAVKTLHKKNYSLLFRRLRIIDLHTRSNQPFSSEDEKVQIVFNGEIYNYLELKEELKKYKISFKTKSDTEVILKSYQVWGISFVKRLRGMFSIIILDEKRKRYLCFRDRLGQKPLYYSKYKEGLIFSSEIKDIIFFKKKNEIIENKEKINNFFYHNSDFGDQTFFKDIYSFPPSSFGIIEKSSIKIKKYWELDIRKNRRFDEEEFKNIFSNNLKLHLRSDVPIAFTLSGGLDSSSIMKESLKYLTKKYHSFSVYSKLEKEKYEKDYIFEFRKKNSVKNSFIDIDNNNKDIIEKFISFTDEPAYSSSFIPQFLLRKKIKNKGYKVLLTGEGADEALGGYDRMHFPFIYSLFLSKNKKIPQSIKKNNILNLDESYFKRDMIKFNNQNYDNNLINFFYGMEFLKKKNLDNPANFYFLKNFRKKNAFKQLLKNHLLISDLPFTLKIEDRISMSQSIESRTPFVDHVFLEYIFSIKNDEFLKNGENKSMLRRVMKNSLPQSFFKKGKIGRPSSVVKYVFYDYFEKILSMLRSKKFENEFFSNDEIFRNLIKDKFNKNFERAHFYFKILNFFLWKKNFS